MDEVLAALAAAQGGVITRQQVLAAGLTPYDIRARLRRTWHDPYRGVYVDRATFDAATPQQRHVLLAAARVRTSTLAPVASHRTAALVHALPLLGRPPRVPQLTRGPRWARDHSETSTVRVAPLPARDRDVVDGVPVTSLARTAVDLARTVRFRSAVVSADAVLRRRVEREALLEVAGRCHSWPGGRRALEVVRFADGRADGPLESITRVAYHLEGLPPPETQVEVRAPDGTFVGLVDFLWREQRVVGEADGAMKYDSPLALHEEKRREDRLRRCGLEIVRSGWDDAWTSPGRRRLAAEVRERFAFTADRPAVRGVTFRVPTLDELLAPPWARAA